MEAISTKPIQRGTAYGKPESSTTPNKGFLEQSYQTLPSVLLNDLARRDASGKLILEHTDIVVYALLKAHAWQKPDCFPGYARLAREASCSPSTIQRSLKRLESAKYIMRKSQTTNGKIVIVTDVKDGQVIRRLIKPAPRANPFATPRPSCTPTLTVAPTPPPALAPLVATLPTVSRTLFPVPKEKALPEVDTDDEEPF